jgi:hypothetical protein
MEYTVWTTCNDDGQWFAEVTDDEAGEHVIRSFGFRPTEPEARAEAEAWVRSQRQSGVNP